MGLVKLVPQILCCALVLNGYRSDMKEYRSSVEALDAVTPGDGLWPWESFALFLQVVLTSGNFSFAAVIFVAKIWSILHVGPPGLVQCGLSLPQHVYMFLLLPYCVVPILCIGAAVALVGVLGAVAAGLYYSSAFLVVHCQLLSSGNFKVLALVFYVGLLVLLTVAMIRRIIECGLVNLIVAVAMFYVRCAVESLTVVATGVLLSLLVAQVMVSVWAVGLLWLYVKCEAPSQLLSGSPLCWRVHGFQEFVPFQKEGFLGDSSGYENVANADENSSTNVDDAPVVGVPVAGKEKDSDANAAGLLANEDKEESAAARKAAIGQATLLVEVGKYSTFAVLFTQIVFLFCMRDARSKDLQSLLETLKFVICGGSWKGYYDGVVGQFGDGWEMAIFLWEHRDKPVAAAAEAWEQVSELAAGAW